METISKKLSVNGYVTYVNPDESDKFGAEITDVDGVWGAKEAKFVAELPISFVAPEERDSLKEGVIFKWEFDSEDYKKSNIVFYRWTEEDIEEAKKMEQEFKELFAKILAPIEEKSDA